MPPTYIVDQLNSLTPDLSPFVNIWFRIFRNFDSPMPSGAWSALKCFRSRLSALILDVNLTFFSFVSWASFHMSSMRPSTATDRDIGTGSLPSSRNRYEARPHAGWLVNAGFAVPVRADTSSLIGATNGTGYQSSRPRYPVCCSRSYARSERVYRSFRRSSSGIRPVSDTGW